MEKGSGTESALWTEAAQLVKKTLILFVGVALVAFSVFLMRWELVTCSGDVSASRGDYDKAIERYESAAEYRDVSEKLADARYGKARELMEQGKYEQAAQMFYELSAHRDSEEQYKECRYLQASELAESGEYIDALVIYRTLGDYKDASELSLSTAKLIFGDDYSEDAYDLSSLSEDEIARRAGIRDRREKMTNGRIAVGFYHTVALKSDGTVLAAGSNDYGQCDVSDWSGVTAVGAGAYFTVGLKRDGSVLFTGLDDYGESAVLGWSGVKAISAGYNMVAGLLEDGTVVAAGRGYHSESASWQDTASIDSGADYITAVSEKGYALSEHPSVIDANYSNLLDMSAADAYTIGVNYSGELVTASGMDLSGWSGDIVDVECGANGFMAVTVDGDVKAYFFRPEYAVDTSGWVGVRELAVGGTHYAAYLEDGSVVCAGRNNCGQLETSGWQLD